MVVVKSKKPVKIKTVICSKCGYELEYTGEDIKFYDKTDYGGGTDRYYHIVCPRETCGT
jgi:hypothetical protein